MTLCRFLDQNESGRQTPNYCLSKIVLTLAEILFLMEPSGRFPTPASPGNILWCSSTPWTGHLCAQQRLWSSQIDWKISRPAVAKSWQFPWIQNSLLFSGPTPPDHREGWGKFRYLSSQIREEALPNHLDAWSWTMELPSEGFISLTHRGISAHANGGPRSRVSAR